jgi:hypothetical protein
MTIYYVDGVSGVDSNNGLTEGTAYRTIQRPLNLGILNPGDTVLVKDIPNGAYSGAVNITVSGSAGNPITFKSFSPAYRPKTSGANNAFNIQANYIEIDGFDCTSTIFDVIVLGNSTQSLGTPINHHITVRNCVVHDGPGNGILGIRSDYLTIEDNIVYNNSYTVVNQTSGICTFQLRDSNTSDLGVHNIIRGNTSYGNINKVPYAGQTGGATQVSDGNGIIIDDMRCVQNNTAGFPAYMAVTLVEKNYCWNNGGRGIHTFLSDNVIIRQNTCWDNLLSANLAGLNLPNSNGDFHTYLTGNVIFEENRAYRTSDTTNCHCFHDGNSSSTNKFINNTYTGTIDINASALRVGMVSAGRYI